MNPFLIAALSGLLIGLSVCSAQASAALDQDQLHFRRLSVKDGLPSAYINTLYQRRDGFIWIGSKGGLSRFDGQYFQNFGYSTETGLLSSDITALYETPTGELWVGASNGAYRYREPANRFDHVPLLDRPTTVLAFAQHEPDSLWVGTDLGLFQIAVADGRVLRDLQEPHVRWLRVLDGQLWIAGANGLYRYDLAAEQLHRIPLDRNPATDVRHEELYDVALVGDEFWLATRRDGLLKFDPHTEQVRAQLLRSDSMLVSSNVWTIVAREDQVWLGYFYDGLHRINRNDDRHALFSSQSQVPHSLPYNNVSELLFDSGGNLWVGTTNGLAVANLATSAIRHLGSEHGISDRHVWSVAQQDQQLWFGTENGLNRLDLADGALAVYPSTERENGLPRTVIWSLFPWQDKVFLGTNRGLLLFDPDTQVARWPLVIPNGAGVSARTEVYSLRAWNERLLLGFSNGTFGIYDPATNTLESTVPNVVPSYVTDMEAFADGFVVAGRRGLGFVRAQQAETLAPADAVTGQSLDWQDTHFTSLVATEGLLWAGSNTNGLFALARDPEGSWRVVHHIGRTDGLDSDQIKSLMLGDKGSLWVATARSLFRVDLADCSVHRYHDYLHWLDMEFNDNAVPQSRSSLLALGGNQGLILTDPRQLTRPPVKRQVRLTSIQIMERELMTLPDAGQLVVQPDETFYTFFFSALEYLSPDMIRYQYQLAPIDDSWRDMKGSQLSLSRLPYGEYQLSVRALGQGEQQQLLPFTLTLIVQPPLWLSLPAKVAYGLLALTALIGWLLINRRRIAAITHVARHDSLTGLPNRYYLQAELEARLNQARERGEQMAVLFFDLNGFKAINDNYGHKVGDALLVHVARNVAGCIRHGDFLARQSGDEFVLLLSGLQEPQDLERAMTRVLAAFKVPFEYGGDTIAYGSSVGVALCEGSDSQLNTEQLLHRADLAMYHSKQQGTVFSLWGREVTG